MRKIGLSLFSCSGIGELLLSSNGIEVLLSNEIDEEIVKLYRLNHPRVESIVGDIRNERVKGEIIRRSLELGVEYIQATPPCQGFSTIGKLDSNDSRNDLIMDTVEVIRGIQPKWVLIENVIGFSRHKIVTMTGIKGVMEYIRGELSNYEVESRVINSADYGISQIRKRTIVLISRKDVRRLIFPEISRKWKRLDEVIGDLPRLESGETSIIEYHYSLIHNREHQRWMRHTATGKSAKDNEVEYPQIGGRAIRSFGNTYKRMRWDRPSPTVTRNSGVISSQTTVHPGRRLSDGTYSDARCLSLKELMLISGIDGLYKIPREYKERVIRLVIGESLLPIIPYEILKQIREY